jgi:hypothetical protein
VKETLLVTLMMTAFVVGLGLIAVYMLGPKL